MKKLFISVVAAATVCGTVAAPAQAAPVPAPAPGGPGPIITYVYIGPSTSMKTHREYRITVRDGVATIRVGNYSSVWGTAPPTATETATLDATTWRALSANVDALPRAAAGQPCPGAAQHRVEYAIGKAKPRVTLAYTCATGGAGDVRALKAYIAPVEAKFDMDRLLA
ncbi:hypothetical protein [Tsukamurella sp. 1534]|uniref:hypothetical protein n=1 Tax=Tsukamurella sp. 1534 TaxID=1151061 RepID=UPI0002F5A337|nr:hypothetical protein [Tsukamurella sp. 1534]